MAPVLKTADEVYHDVRQAAEALWGLGFSNPRPLTLGLLNLKWMVDTAEGAVVVKQFSRERYQQFDLDRVAVEQEIALREQRRLWDLGIPCPRLWTHDEMAIQRSASGERFVVMEYIRGEHQRPGTVNLEQMYSLGQATALMHNGLNDGHRTETLPKFQPPRKEERLAFWRATSAAAPANEPVQERIVQQIRATEQFDVACLEACRPGLAHRDLWVDNLLFTGSRLAAILDFDRVAFDYPALDIARAIMSGALAGDHLNTAAAFAFVEGYRARRVLEEGAVVRSLQLLWYMESVWWIGPHINRDRYQEVQFENEMVWLATHLSDLPAIFS